MAGWLVHFHVPHPLVASCISFSLQNENRVLTFSWFISVISGCLSTSFYLFFCSGNSEGLIKSAEALPEVMSLTFHFLFFSTCLLLCFQMSPTGASNKPVLFNILALSYSSSNSIWTQYVNIHANMVFFEISLYVPILKKTIVILIIL